MKILHLEASSRNCSVAISEGDQLLSLCEEVSESYKQSEKLHTFVEWALEGAEVSLKDISCVALGVGPGSYTGLRIGSSSAKGFCYALELPLVAVNSLYTLKEPFLNKGYDAVIPLIDARRLEVYTAIFDGATGIEISETTNLILDEDSFSELEGKKVLFVGDGAEKAKDIISITADFQPNVYPSAKYLLPEAFQKIQKNQFEDIAYFEPFYLKDFQGVKKKNI